MQPNFLVFVTDQQRADHLGCYGNNIVRTPHIDGLAAAGTRFERAYVANPVCMPNRGSMMTGRMPTNHGTRGNGIPLPLESVTFADVLAEFGYRTALIGKSHLQNMEDKPPALPPRTVEPGIRESRAYPEAVRDATPPRVICRRPLRAGETPRTSSTCRITVSRTSCFATTTPTNASATICGGCS